MSIHCHKSCLQAFRGAKCYVPTAARGKKSVCKICCHSLRTCLAKEILADTKYINLFPYFEKIEEK